VIGGVLNLSGFAIDDTSVYWAGLVTDRIGVSFGGPRYVWAVSKAPLQTTTELHNWFPFGGVTDPPVAMAVDRASIYWTTRGAVMRMSLVGANPAVLASGWPLPPPQGPPSGPDGGSGLSSRGGIAVDGTSVYWTECGGAAADGTVMKTALEGGTPTAFASAQARPMGVAVDAVNVYWANNGSSDVADGTVMRVPHAGGPPTTLASGQAGPVGIAADSVNVYWTSSRGPGTGSVMKVPIDGGTPTAIALDQARPCAIVVDGSSVYWTNAGASGGGDGSVMKVALSGGTPTTLATDQASPVVIAVDATNLYWANAGGTVMRQHLGICRSAVCR
jgi:hypothetical protein